MVYLALLVAISWQLTALVAVATLLISHVGRRIMRRAGVLSRLLRRANAGLAHRMFQGLQGMKLIRTFGREAFEAGRFDRASGQVSRILLHLGLLRGTLEPVYEILIAAVLIGILAIGLSNPDILPSLLVFIVLLYRLQGKVKQFDSLRVSIASSRAAVEDLSSLLNPADKPYVRSGNSPFRPLKRSVRFDDVSFRYPGSPSPALTHISIEIPAGKVTAVVGRSGAGKTTLIGLLLRLLEPSAGAILVDGVPLADLDLTSWRQNVAVVSQDMYLFDASVRDNIAYGKLDASEDEIVSAAKLAHAHEFIMALPDGYRTHVGERGVRLSGGQQQRLALARAMVRKPALLILDEATNALDAISEQLIQRALDTVSKESTLLVIAHRFSTIEKADQIIVLADGRVVETGPAGELKARGELFAQLHHLQMGGGPHIEAHDETGADTSGRGAPGQAQQDGSLGRRGAEAERARGQE